MTVEVTHNGTCKGEPAEDCCICYKPTRYWYGTGDHNVALCPSCAQRVEADNLPTKREWCAEAHKRRTRS